jgi:hypothetical protein
VEPDVQQESVNRQDFNFRYTKGFNMTVTIEKNIPKPAKVIGARGTPASKFGTVKYVWLHQMEIGDSVRFTKQSEAHGAVACVHRLKKIEKLPQTFKLEQQTVVENGGKFIRVWRIA